MAKISITRSSSVCVAERCVEPGDDGAASEQKTLPKSLMRDHTTAREVVDGVAIDAEELGDFVGGHHVTCHDVGNLRDRFGRCVRRFDQPLECEHECLERLERLALQEVA